MWCAFGTGCLRPGELGGRLPCMHWRPWPPHTCHRAMISCLTHLGPAWALMIHRLAPCCLPLPGTTWPWATTRTHPREWSHTPADTCCSHHCSCSCPPGLSGLMCMPRCPAWARPVLCSYILNGQGQLPAFPVRVACQQGLQYGHLQPDKLLTGGETASVELPSGLQTRLRLAACKWGRRFSPEAC